MEPILKMRGRDGQYMEEKVDHRLYKEAADRKLSVPDLLAQKFGHQVDLHYGTPFEQAVMHSGLLLAHQRPQGVAAPTMKQIMDDNLAMNLNAVRAPDGSSNAVSARLLFPQVIMEVMRNYLVQDQSDFIEGYNRMVATTENVTSPRVDQPFINEKANEDVEEGQMAQLAEPPSLVQITVGDKSWRIPTDGIGLMVSDEALESTTLDLVGLAMTAHARGKRIRTVERNIKAMVDGDQDRGMGALTPVTAQSFDSSITTAGTVTRKAWLKFLRDGYQKRNINGVMMNLDTYLALEDELMPKNFSQDPRQTSTPNTLLNMGLVPQNILLVADTVLGANRIVGLDTRYAIRRLVNVSAAYEGIENFVLRKAKAFRVDHGEMSHRLYDEAWSVMDLTV